MALWKKVAHTPGIYFATNFFIYEWFSGPG